MIRKWALGCGIPLLLVGLSVFYASKALLKPKPKQERSETVSRGIVEIKVVETGTIEPLRKVEVKSKAGGRVLRLFVDEGAQVRPGQVLASIDPQEINSQVEALRAQVAGAQARWEAARKGVEFQEEQTRTSIEQTRKSLEAMRARLQSAEMDAAAQPEITARAIAIAEANLDAAKANLQVQEANLTMMMETTHPQAIVNAQAAYDRARAQAENGKRNLQRLQQLLEKGFVAQQAVDNTETELRVAEAQVREAKQRLDRIQQTNELEAANARSQVASAKSQVRQMEAALAQARANVLPYMKKQDMENLRALYAQTQAQLAAARSNRTQDKMRRDEALAAQANVRQLENQLKELLVRQNDTTLMASMAGVVTKRYVEQGELITSAISSFSSGTPVFQISDLATMLVKININEVDVSKLKVGLPVEVTMDSARGVLFRGKVRKVAPAALTAASASDSASRNTGNTSSTQTVIRFLVEVQIDQADTRLKPGMSARCSVLVARRENVIRVPINCLQGEGEDATVQIVTSTIKDGQKVETTTPRKVKVGLRGDDFAEILSGLKEGEKLRPNPYTGPERKTIDVNTGP